MIMPYGIIMTEMVGVQAIKFFLYNLSENKDAQIFKEKMLVEHATSCVYDTVILIYPHVFYAINFL